MNRGQEMLNNIKAPTPDEVEKASGVSQQAVKNWPAYVRQCQMRKDLVERAVRNYGSEDFSTAKILDWGCALGGVALMLAEEHRTKVYCADVDPRSLRWLSQFPDHAIPVQLGYEPTLPFADNEFDIIYGISVFTHIPPQSQSDYISELARISKPGGLVLLTFTSHWALSEENTSNMPELPAPEKLSSEGIVFYKYPKNVLDHIGFGDNYEYGRTYHSHDYIRELTSPYFEQAGIESPALAYQDLVALRSK